MKKSSTIQKRDFKKKSTLFKLLKLIFSLFSFQTSIGMVRYASLANKQINKQTKPTANQDNTNSDELDQKNNNRADLNEIKLTVKDDDQQQRLFGQDGALSLHPQNVAQRRPDESSANSATVIDQSNSLISNGSLDGRLYTSVITTDNLNNLNSGNSNGRSDSNADQQSLPPAYFEVPGIVPFMAASSNQPPPSYEEVNKTHLMSLI